ncbi:sensor histidine kinase [Streptomyces sp. NPDC046712]|uniref:sensor histidine kinase n=1 Tax=Streptomyces sp. NPDC046712 TaxID=3154802 RepID=UPI0033F2F5BD
MPRVVDAADKGERVGDGYGRTLIAGLRGAPRALREDLWTTARDPLPRQAWFGWLPHGHLVLLAVVAGVANMAGYSNAMDVLSAPMQLFVVLQAAALVLALSRPVPAWWLSTVSLFLTAEIGESTVGPDMVWPWSVWGIVVHTFIVLLLALRVPLRVTVATFVITVLTGAAHTVVPTGFPHNEDLAGGTLSFATAAVVGASLRISRVARTRLVEQEVLTAEERARRTVLEERGRIARELHDVVAHHMSVISIQAQVAPHLVENPSAELRENLAGIRQNAVEALTELRRVLGVLRAEDAAADAVRHAPQPTLDRLDELLDNVRAAGLTVDAATTGERHALSPGVELSAYRIVQEALSNAMRHAPGARVRVETRYLPHGITLRIANTPPSRPADAASAPQAPGMGHGLLGMRERTAMLGGELTAGPTPDGGYEVTATLPTETCEDGT